MKKQFTLAVLVVLCLALFAPLTAKAQQQEAPVYTFVALWAVPRAQWAEYGAWVEKTQPVLERLFKDGTIVSWGRFETLVHTEEGYTHGAWWQSSSIAGIERTLKELLKLPPSPALTGARHRDHLYRSLVYRTKGPGSGPAYLEVNASQVQPGKGDEWRGLFDKYTKPTIDELLTNGTITHYELQVEDYHTMNSGWRWGVTILPNAESIDKVNDAFRALNNKRTAEEREAIGAAFREVTVPGAHWDYVARVTNYQMK